MSGYPEGRYWASTSARVVALDDRVERGVDLTELVIDALQHFAQIHIMAAERFAEAGLSGVTFEQSSYAHLADDLVLALRTGEVSIVVDPECIARAAEDKG